MDIHLALKNYCDEAKASLQIILYVVRDNQKQYVDFKQEKM